MTSLLLKSNVCAIVLLIAAPTLAGPGHDHDHAEPAAAASLLTLPRLTAQSELFEAVGILGREELIVFVDRAANNEPVLNAKVELESGPFKALGKFEAALGEYHFDAKAFSKAGQYPITLTIIAGSDSDLLTGELDVHAASTATATATHGLGWRQIAGWAAGVLAALAGIAVGVSALGRRRVNQKNRIGGSV